MNNTKNKKVPLIKKIVTIVLGVLGIGTITSCYGMDPGPEWRGSEFYGTVYEESYDANGTLTWKERKGVKVSLVDNQNDLLYDLDYTTDSGSYVVYSCIEGKNAELIFEPYNLDKNRNWDIEQNGYYFETKHVPVELKIASGGYGKISENVTVRLKRVKADSAD